MDVRPPSHYVVAVVAQPLGESFSVLYYLLTIVNELRGKALLQGDGNCLNPRVCAMSTVALCNRANPIWCGCEGRPAGPGTRPRRSWGRCRRGFSRPWHSPSEHLNSSGQSLCAKLMDDE